MTIARLDAAAVDAALADLPGWARVGGELRASWRFASFAAAVAFTNALAELAEAQQHHPEWRVAYRRVDVATTTHDAGGLTRRDLELARAVSALARRADAEFAS
ncbi:MAG: 4a-hydroxytetrahydrobiopterin dehydratase [Planctomycetota bacterium]